MTADIANQTEPTGPSTILHTLTLAFAALTLVFTLFSLVFGNRLATLQSNFVQVQNATASSEATTIQEMQAALTTAQQALDAEKKATKQLRSQIAATTKNLKKAKTDLAKANQVLDALKSTPAAESLSSPETSLPDTPPATAPAVESVPSPALEKTDSSLQPSDSVGSEAQKTIANQPKPTETKAPVVSAGAPEKPVKEEYISDSPPTVDPASE